MMQRPTYVQGWTNGAAHCKKEIDTLQSEVTKLKDTIKYLEGMVEEEPVVLIEGYVLCPDEKLSPKALELKRSLLKKVGELLHKENTRLKEELRETFKNIE